MMFTSSYADVMRVVRHKAGLKKSWIMIASSWCRRGSWTQACQLDLGATWAILEAGVLHLLLCSRTGLPWAAQAGVAVVVVEVAITAVVVAVVADVVAAVGVAEVVVDFFD